MKHLNQQNGSSFNLRVMNHITGASPRVMSDMRKYYVTQHDRERMSSVIDMDALFTANLYTHICDAATDDPGLAAYYWADNVHLAASFLAEQYLEGTWMYGMYVHLNANREAVITNDKLKVSVTQDGRFFIQLQDHVKITDIVDLIDLGMLSVLRIVRDICSPSHDYDEPEVTEEVESTQSKSPFKPYVDTPEFLEQEPSEPAPTPESETLELDKRSLNVKRRKGTGRQATKVNLESAIREFCPDEDLTPYLYVKRSEISDAMDHTTVMADNGVHFLINMVDGNTIIVVPYKWYVTMSPDGQHGSSLRDFFKYFTTDDLADMEGMIAVLRAVKEIMSKSSETFPGLDSDK